MTQRLTRDQLLRRGAAGASLLTIPGLLAACGGSGSKTTPSTSTGKQQLAKTLRFSNWTLYMDTNQKNHTFPSLIEFEKKFGVHVDYMEDINDNSTFGAKIEPADTEKNALVIAHPGAAEYINDETKSFMDRYSDALYLGAAALSIIGTIFAGIYTKITRIAPEKASELATAILDVGERVEYAKSLDALDELQDELETILRGVVIGLRDGTISTDGLDTFKLGYEFVRDEIGMRRDHLKRHPPPQDDKVVTVKTAHSA